MDLESRKISFVQEFLRLQNEDIVSSLEKFLRSKKTEMIESSLKPMSMTQYDSEFDRAMEDSRNDRIINVQDLKSKVEQWD